ncbi:MAG: hypothetical protein Q9187_008117 [Circinaria calcarea]
MDDLHISHSSLDHSGLSVRSRASSTISTGTKFSIATLPYEDQFPNPTAIDVLLGSRNIRLTSRPDSVLSITSSTQPPPYEVPPEIYGASTPLAISPTDRNGSQDYITASVSRTPTQSQSPSPSQSQPASPNTATTFDHENALSQYYTQVVRTIDANHHAELARLKTTHIAELASTRHAIDAAYRRELKSKDLHVEQIRRESAKEVADIEDKCRKLLEERDRQMEQLRQESAGRIADTEAKCISTIKDLMQECEARVHKATNEVEDLWEGRWKDRARISEEEAARRDEGMKAQLYGHRDEVWMRVLGEKWVWMKSDLDAVKREVEGVGD